MNKDKEIEFNISDDESVNRLMNSVIRAEPPVESDTLITSIHASRVASCIRQTYYDMTGATPDIDNPAVSPSNDDKPLDEYGKFVMGFGNLFEELVTTQLQLLGVWRGKVRISNRELLISGETDPIAEWEDKKILFECKATNRGSYFYKLKEFNSGKCDYSYYSQIQTYLWALPEIDFGVLLIANRDMKVKDDMPPMIWKRIDRDKKWYDLNTKRISSLVKSLKLNQLPEREFTYDSWQCQYCQYSLRCWNIDKAGSNEPDKSDKSDNTISGAEIQK